MAAPELHFVSPSHLRRLTISAPKIALSLYLTLTIGLSGCYSWHAYEYPSPDAAEPVPFRLRATRHDSSQVVLTDAVLRDDTLYGYSKSQSVTIPMTDIAGLHREKLSASRTLGTMVAVPAALAGLIYFIRCGNRGCETHY